MTVLCNLFFFFFLQFDVFISHSSMSYLFVTPARNDEKGELPPIGLYRVISGPVAALVNIATTQKEPKSGKSLLKWG